MLFISAIEHLNVPFWKLKIDSLKKGNFTKWFNEVQ
jgi:hypothetical protein